VSLWGLLAPAALLLGVERACYVWIARAPGSFRRWCARPPISRIGEPVAVVRVLFVGFKALQAVVFAGWCLALQDASPLVPHGGALGVGAVLVLVGQALGALVFYRLGRVGIFYGDRLGHDVAWCTAFPFTVLSHPQYVGAVMTIWGVFLIARFPHPDWYLLPVLETVYYVVGTRLEGASRPPRFVVADRHGSLTETESTLNRRDRRGALS
jgi:methylene-fatty-acyl-phospholipid synthase